MQRFSATFVAICMVLIAAALGAVLYLVFAVNLTESVIAAIAGLCALALYNAVSNRLRDRVNLTGQIGDLSRGTADMARQVVDLGRRVDELSRRITTLETGGKAAGLPITAELGELGTMIRQLAETVAGHENALAELKSESNTDAEIGAGSVAAVKSEPRRFIEPAPEPAVAANLQLEIAAARAADDDETTAVIRSAIEASRVDLYLQPTVTLPQRKVRYYEALARLRDEDGKVLQPPDFLPSAESSGLIARIDNMLLFRCVQVLRRLQIKNREIGLFCNIAAATLNDGQIFPQMLHFMEANRALAPTLTLEFKQSVWRDMGPIELEGLAALRELGFRFGMDQVTDLRMEPRDLADRGVRFVKAPAALLLGRTGAPRTDIDTADLSNLLGRHGINLIADRIETEAEVVDLLECDLRFGQGFLFSAPRPVRAEALQGSGDAPAQPDAPAGEAFPAQGSAPSGSARVPIMPAAATLGG